LLPIGASRRRRLMRAIHDPRRSPRPCPGLQTHRGRPDRGELPLYTTGTKEFFAGDLIETSSTDAILLRQTDGTEVLIFRRHIVAITAAADGAEPA
jgi:hypothetical protein